MLCPLCACCAAILSTRALDALHTVLTYVFPTCGRHSPDDRRVLRQQYHDDQYDHYRDYWQRPAFGSRILAGRAGAQTPLHAWTQGQQQVFSTTADVHHDDAYYWRFRDEDHAAGPVWSGGESPDERPVPPPRRRAMKNLQYSVEAGLVQPLEARFGKSKDQIVHNYDLTPSNQASARGSFRSDGSGQSQVRRPFSQLSYAGSNVPVPSDMELAFSRPQFTRSTLHSSLPLRPQTLMPFHQRQVASIYQPHDSRFQTSSPAGFDSTFPQSFGSFTRELSSIRRGNTLSESLRPEPQRLSWQTQSQLRELPSLRPIHEPIGQFSQAAVQPFYRASQDSASLRATVPIGRSISQFAGRAGLSRAPLLEPVPEAIYDSAPVHTHRIASK